MIIMLAQLGWDSELGNNESSYRPRLHSTKTMVLMNLVSPNLDNKPFMNSFSHPCCQKKLSVVNSCQSAVKVYLQILLNQAQYLD